MAESCRVRKNRMRFCRLHLYVVYLDTALEETEKEGEGILRSEFMLLLSILSTKQTERVLNVCSF